MDNESELKVIESDHRGDIRGALRKTLELALKENPDLTWENVVAALRNIREITTARTIENKFCRNP